MEPDLFDYAPIMTRMEQLQRQIHDMFLERKYAEAAPLVDDLLYHCRMLRIWNLEQTYDRHEN